MSRIDEIESFLEYFKRLYKENPNVNFTPDTFYSRLASYDFSPEEIDENFRKTDPEVIEMFYRWCQDFKDNPNLSVYTSKTQKRFLQFENASIKNIKDPSTCYKLYLSIRKEDLYDSVKDIFSFIADNNIDTVSKVADTERSDVIVLRIINKEDTMKVMNYINNNSNIVNSCKSTNPFLGKEGVVGYAFDEHLSYNDVLSKLLYDYFYNKRIHNTLDEVSRDDFLEHVMNRYNWLIENPSFLKNMMNDDLERLGKRKMTFEEVADNYRRAMEMIIHNVDKDNLTNYYEKVEEYKRIDKERENSKTNVKERIFLEACKATLDNHGMVQLKTALEKGLENNFKYFTNKNNCREKLENNLTSDEFAYYAMAKLNEINYELSSGKSL